MKMQFFVEISLFITLVEGKTYPAALHKTPTQTLDSSQVLIRHKSV